MQILQNHHRKNGFDYYLFDRINNKAIYTQMFNSDIVGYEVFKVKSHNGYVIAGNNIPPSEIFPSNEDFGATAWAFADLKKALEKYAEL